MPLGQKCRLPDENLSRILWFRHSCGHFANGLGQKTSGIGVDRVIQLGASSKLRMPIMYLTGHCHGEPIRSNADRDSIEFYL